MFMTIATRAKKVKENLLTLLEEHPDTRNDDRLLMLKYWERFDGVDLTGSFQDQFTSGITNPESIRRGRQSIQNAGLFLPTDEEVLKRRRMLAEETRQHYAAN
jgi:hypothetical protein